ncbi:MAG: hypothetical protein NXI31_24300 [bacterium]|nr:hypothetical protein [bacterium]
MSSALLSPLSGQEKTRFTNLAGSFVIDLPAGFRQLSPNEASRLAERADTPRDLHTTSPRAFYAVGRVDDWLEHGVSSPWLYVMEQEQEWHIDGDFATLLRERWQESGAQTGYTHELSDIRPLEVGPRKHEVHVARRTSTSPAGRSITSLDVYAPTGGRQVTLSFCAFSADFERWLESFEDTMATLTFSRPSRGEISLSDRLWTPLVTGALVGLVLLGLYKHTRRTR